MEKTIKVKNLLLTIFAILLLISFVILPFINLCMYRNLLADLLDDHYILETYEERLIYYNAYKFATITVISILVMGLAYLVIEITLAIKNKKKGNKENGK